MIYCPTGPVTPTDPNRINGHSCCKSLYVHSSCLPEQGWVSVFVCENISRMFHSW